MTKIAKITNTARTRLYQGPCPFRELPEPMHSRCHEAFDKMTEKEALDLIPVDVAPEAIGFIVLVEPKAYAGFVHMPLQKIYDNMVSRIETQFHEANTKNKTKKEFNLQEEIELRSAHATIVVNSMLLRSFTDDVDLDERELNELLNMVLLVNNMDGFSLIREGQANGKLALLTMVVAKDPKGKDTYLETDIFVHCSHNVLAEHNPVLANARSRFH